ncbi:hypothetical protein PAXRUDRAFT_166140 [Paxillus rubicundulus Ve08.2h10]|uniref:Uncharacterized protein n=1 Tax=Paxillus rubicundulus Ve08.2h10 TaxID=930991 RepID=A0A0D0DHU3_9AGAM|nr:hypothetical protein PAXRUDRAFT_166140 [Paxillus rubicundulus Ve08.2h10]
MANHEAADTLNWNAMSTGTTKPAGTSYGLPNINKEVKGRGGKGERDERVSGSAAPSLNNENAAPNSIPPPPNPDKCKCSPPLSIMLLEGEKTGQQSSRHPDETTTHLAQHKCARRRTLCMGQTARSKVKKGGKESSTRGQVGAQLPAQMTIVIPNSTPTPPYPVERRSTQTPKHVAQGGEKILEVEQRQQGPESPLHICQPPARTHAGHHG